MQRFYTPPCSPTTSEPHARNTVAVEKRPEGYICHHEAGELYHNAQDVCAMKLGCLAVPGHISRLIKRLPKHSSPVVACLSVLGALSRASIITPLFRVVDALQFAVYTVDSSPYDII